MNEGLEELKRLAYENACCRCQYYIDKKCTNNYECIWLDIEKELKALEIIKKCFYVAKSSGAILLTDYGFEHKEELKEVLL